MSTYSTHLSHPSLPLLLDHQQNSPNNLQAQTDSTQESRKNLVPKEAYLKDSVRGVMPIDPNLYHCLAPIYDRVDVDKSRVGAALYLAGQHGTLVIKYCIGWSNVVVSILTSCAAEYLMDLFALYSGTMLGTSA